MPSDSASSVTCFSRWHTTHDLKRMNERCNTILKNHQEKKKVSQLHDTVSGDKEVLLLSATEYDRILEQTLAIS